MSDVSQLDKGWELGFIWDVPRDQLPKGAAYLMKDWIPRLDSPLRRRGAWANMSIALQGTTYDINGLAWAPFSANNDDHPVAMTSDNKVWKVDLQGNPSTAVGTGLTNMNEKHPPFWHKDRVIIPTKANGTNPRKYYDPANNAIYAVADVGGTPPQFSVGCSWGDYLVGANGYVGGVLFQNRSWFSGVGTPDIWTPATSYVDLPEQIVAVVPRPNFLLYLGYNGAHQLVGAVPPPGGDMTLKKYVFNQGTFDARSVAVYKDQVIWANNTGVWKSDGTTITNMTEQGGISRFWKLNVGKFFSPGAGYAATAGIYSGHYIISITLNGALVTLLVCDIERSVWFEFTNIAAIAFAWRPAGKGGGGPGTAGTEELFFGRAGIASQVVTGLARCWDPSFAGGSGTDPNAVALYPQLETAFYNLGQGGLKRARRTYFTYELYSAVGAPKFQVSYAATPDATTYTSAGFLLETAQKVVRRMFSLRKKLIGVSFKLAMSTGLATDVRLHAIEIESHALEGSRR